MASGSLIESIKARQVFSDRGHPGVETTVVTENGGVGTAEVTAGVSVGKYEVQFAYDGGEKWKGLGVMKAVSNIHEVIAPALIGKDATKQREIDGLMLELDGTPNKAKLGGNSIGSVSAAVLKAGAASLGIPLYQHIGGVNACILPTPGVGCLGGSNRYGGGERAGGKPSHSFMAHGFDTFSDASYACWKVRDTYDGLLARKLGLQVAGLRHVLVPPGLVEHDRELWDLMVEAIGSAGYEGKIGIQVDVAAGCYYDKDKDIYIGLFSREDKLKEDLIALYKDMAASYPFVIFEDPLDEDDYEGHAVVTKEVPIQIVGDDLFVTNPERLRKGIEMGACNSLLWKVNQIGSLTEASDAAELAMRSGYTVMASHRSGDTEDPFVADLSVGIGCGQIKTGAPARGERTAKYNQLLRIEEWLGEKARYPRGLFR